MSDLLTQLQKINAALPAGPWNGVYRTGKDAVWMDIVDAMNEDILSAETLYVGQLGSEQFIKELALVESVAALRNMVPALIEHLSEKEKS